MNKKCTAKPAEDKYLNHNTSEKKSYKHRPSEAWFLVTDF